jgi:1-deoxy-D-xylulose 5-phosphate reductoisomerase
MFIDHQVGYLDIMRLNEAACEAHAAELVALPTLDEIVHYDQWVRCVCLVCCARARGWWRCVAVWFERGCWGGGVVWS